MADEPETTDLPSTLPEATSAPEPVETDELDTDASLEADGEQSEAPPEDDGIDLEHEGKKYRIPKALEGYLLRQDDYTRKTQTVAERAKELEQREQQLTQQAQADEKASEARVALAMLDRQLKQYDGVNWPEEYAKSPENAGAHKAVFDQLMIERSKATAFLTQQDRQRADEAQRADAKRISTTIDWATKNIKGWNNALDVQLTDFVTKELPEDLRLSEEFVKRNVNPKLYNLMYLARLGYQAQKRVSAAKPTPAPAPEPITPIRAKTPVPPTGLSDRLSPDEWIRRRNEQVARKAAGR